MDIRSTGKRSLMEREEIHRVPDNCHLRTTPVHRPSTNRVRWLPRVSCLLRIGLIWLSLAGDVNSGTGGTVLFPMSNFPTRKPSGLQLEISSSWV